MLGNFLRGKCSLHHQIMGSCAGGAQGHRHKAALCLISYLQEKGAEPQRWGVGGGKDEGKHQKKYWRDRLETSRRGRGGGSDGGEMKGEK